MATVTSGSPKLGIPVSFLDDAIRARRPASDESDGQGTKLELSPPEPWPEPVNGAELMTQICDAINKYVVLDSESVCAIGLWIIASHAYMAFSIFPRLFLKSPVPECGKSTLLGVLAPLTSMSVTAQHSTTSALFRLIERYDPTV
jgi:putative DNA primase/helicase